LSLAKTVVVRNIKKSLGFDYEVLALGSVNVAVFLNFEDFYK